MLPFILADIAPEPLGGFGYEMDLTLGVLLFWAVKYVLEAVVFYASGFRTALDQKHLALLNLASAPIFLAILWAETLWLLTVVFGIELTLARKFYKKEKTHKLFCTVLLAELLAIPAAAYILDFFY